MRLIFLIDCIARWGGTERILVDKMNHFAQMGHDVFLITINQGRHPYVFEMDKSIVKLDLNIQMHFIYKYHGFRKFVEFMFREYRLYKRLYKQIKKIAPDIITCTIPSDFYTILYLYSNLPVIIVESHMSTLDSFNYHIPNILKPLILFRDKKALRKANCIVSLTDGDAKEWRKYNDNVAVIPNVVHLNNSSLYSEHSKKKVIFVGRLAKQKGLNLLLDIWEIVHQRHNDWILDIYGEGDMEEWLKEQINNNNINIVLHKPTLDIHECYKNSSMLVLTSNYEPFGLVIPEAMSCGLPVVSFDCPYGPRDIITDGEDGYLVQPGDCETFTDKICYLIEHPEERKKMGKNAINSAQRYKPEKIMPIWIELYNFLTNEL